MPVPDQDCCVIAHSSSPSALAALCGFQPQSGRYRGVAADRSLMRLRSAPRLSAQCV